MRNQNVSQENFKSVYEFRNEEFDEKINNLKHDADCEGHIDFLIRIKDLAKQIKNHQQQIKVCSLACFFSVFVLFVRLFLCVCASFVLYINSLILMNIVVMH